MPRIAEIPATAAMWVAALTVPGAAAVVMLIAWVTR
jgi:hypothetical protein